MNDELRVVVFEPDHGSRLSAGEQCESQVLPGKLLQATVRLHPGREIAVTTKVEQLQQTAWLLCRRNGREPRSFPAGRFRGAWLDTRDQEHDLALDLACLIGGVYLSQYGEGRPFVNRVLRMASGVQAYGDLAVHYDSDVIPLLVCMAKPWVLANLPWALTLTFAQLSSVEERIIGKVRSLISLGRLISPAPSSGW